MNDQNAFEKRGASFEAEYFNRKDAELVRKLQGVFQKKVDAESISKVSGVTDSQLIARMAELNLNGELMAAFQIYPLVEVAWADGNLDSSEAQAVIAAAEKRGITKGSSAHDYLGERLKAGASSDILKIWMAYAAELKQTLTPTELDSFRKDVLDLCRNVAESSGGMLGRLFTVGSEEKKVLGDIERALTA